MVFEIPEEYLGSEFTEILVEFPWNRCESVAKQLEPFYC